jgi:hypothetical protein
VVASQLQFPAASGLTSPRWIYEKRCSLFHNRRCRVVHPSSQQQAVSPSDPSTLWKLLSPFLPTWLHKFDCRFGRRFLCPRWRRRLSSADNLVVVGPICHDSVVHVLLGHYAVVRSSASLAKASVKNFVYWCILHRTTRLFIG